MSRGYRYVGDNEGDRSEDEFASGYCGTFAVALHKVTGLPIWAMVEDDGMESVIHAFVRDGEKMIDARGVSDILRPEEIEGCENPYLRQFTVAQLKENRTYVEDVTQGVDALRMIRRNIEKYGVKK